MATSNLAESLSAYLEGRWRYAKEKAEHAENMFREHCTGVFWEISTTVFVSTGALAYLGEVRRLSNRVRVIHREALDRRDLYAALNVCSGFQNLAWLANDDPVGARTVTAEAIAQWSKAGVHIQHFSDLFAQTNIDLYEGQPSLALERVQSNWTRMRRAMLLEIQQNRNEINDMLARSAIASAAQRKSVRDNLQIAARAATQIEHEDMPWSNPLAKRLRAAVAFVGGQPNLAIPLLGDAADGFERCGMHLFMQAARWCRGNLIGGIVGSTDVASAEDWMLSEGIRTPPRLIDTLVPGFPTQD